MLSGLALSAALLVPSQAPPPAASPPAAAAPEYLPRSATGAAEAPPAASVPRAPATPATSTPNLPGSGACLDTACPPMGDEPRRSLRPTHQGPPYTLWAEVDYLRYWLKPGPIPVPLVAVAPPGGVPQTVIGSGQFEFGPTNGIGFQAGAWLNERHTFGLGAGGFLLEQRAVFGGVNSDALGSPTIIRPFIDALTAQPAQLFVSNPGLIAGGIFTAAGSRLSGGEFFGIHNLRYCRDYSLDLLAGGRYLDLDEYIEVTQVSRPIGPGVVVYNGTRFPGNGDPAVTVADRFRTRNQFYGGTLGLRGEYRAGPVFAALIAKAGVGNNHQVIQVDGATSINVPGLPPIPSGLLAITGGNAGQLVTNRLALVTEAGAQFGVQVSRSARVLIGYDFLYLSNVARPGEQIDPFVNTRLLPTSVNFRNVTGVTSPVATGTRDDFFVHGLRFGLELQY